MIFIYIFFFFLRVCTQKKDWPRPDHHHRHNRKIDFWFDFLMLLSIIVLRNFLSFFLNIKKFPKFFFWTQKLMMKENPSRSSWYGYWKKNLLHVCYFDCKKARYDVKDKKKTKVPVQNPNCHPFNNQTAIKIFQRKKKRNHLSSIFFVVSYDNNKDAKKKKRKKV